MGYSCAFPDGSWTRDRRHSSISWPSCDQIQGRGSSWGRLHRRFLQVVCAMFKRFRAVLRKRHDRDLQRQGYVLRKVRTKDQDSFWTHDGVYVRRIFAVGCGGRGLRCPHPRLHGSRCLCSSSLRRHHDLLAARLLRRQGQGLGVHDGRHRLRGAGPHGRQARTLHGESQAAFFLCGMRFSKRFLHSFSIHALHPARRYYFRNQSFDTDSIRLCWLGNKG
mmetsp:Transcript_52916/g.139357  ORF Transcript_52916/g.139357 Transcript_52916/m.139357 type:complete len:220 (+) Transcript_52916:137-796(+)